MTSEPPLNPYLFFMMGRLAIFNNFLNDAILLLLRIEGYDITSAIRDVMGESLKSSSRKILRIAICDDKIHI